MLKQALMSKQAILGTIKLNQFTCLSLQHAYTLKYFVLSPRENKQAFA
jgi:hypothetical protein